MRVQKRKIAHFAFITAKNGGYTPGIAVTHEYKTAQAITKFRISHGAYTDIAVPSTLVNAKCAIFRFCTRIAQGQRFQHKNAL